MLNTGVLRLGSLASSIVLARLLSPDDFGVFAIALTVQTLLLSTNELGVSLALVQRPGDVREIAPTVMTMAVAGSVALYGLTFALAPTLAGWIDAPDATGVIRLMSVAILLDGLGTVPIGLLNRAFLQKRLFVGEAVAFTVLTAVTISLAVAGAGAYSFAWGTVAGSVAGTITHTCLAPLRVRPGWNRTVVRPLLRSGLPLAGASLLLLSVANVDNLVVGAVLGQALLGYYLLAFRQANIPLLAFAEAARRVALAGFSRLSDDREQLSRAFNRGLALLMAATVPGFVMLAAFAEPLIRVLYGARWVPAAQALPFLAVLGLLRVALLVGYDLLVAIDRPRLLAALQLVWLVALVPLLWFGAREDGIRGAGAAHALVAGLLVTPLFLGTLRRLRISPLRALAACRRPALGGAALALAAWLVNATVDGDVARLLSGGATVLAVYLPIVWPMRSLLPPPAAAPAELPPADAVRPPVGS